MVSCKFFDNPPGRKRLSHVDSCVSLQGLINSTGVSAGRKARPRAGLQSNLSSLQLRPSCLQRRPDICSQNVRQRLLWGSSSSLNRTVERCVVTAPPTAPTPTFRRKPGKICREEKKTTEKLLSRTNQAGSKTLCLSR